MPARRPETWQARMDAARCIIGVDAAAVVIADGAIDGVNCRHRYAGRLPADPRDRG